MKEVLSYSNAAIMAIPKDRPDKLFDVDHVAEQGRKLYSKWHPDRCKEPNADKVFAYIKELKETAISQIGLGDWRGAGKLYYSVDSKTYKFSYRHMRPFELGKMYIGNTKLLFVLDKDHRNLFDNAVRMMKTGIKYPKDKFKDQFERYMPKIVNVSKGSTIGDVIVLEKTDELVLLKDLLDSLPDRKLPPRHVAWIISSTLNTMCFLHVIGINSNAITSSNMFISPPHHTTVWLSGWWYATANEDRLLALPGELTSFLPSKVLVDKVSKLSHNLLALRAMALEALGDPSKTGSVFLKNPGDIPKPMLDWLRSTPADSPIKEYELWGEALTGAWGKRKYVDLQVNLNEIY